MFSCETGKDLKGKSIRDDFFGFYLNLPHQFLKTKDLVYIMYPVYTTQMFFTYQTHEFMGNNSSN